MKNQTELFNRSKEIVPGGVHSPVRSFKGLHTTPRFIESADGAYIKDTEGKSYIDFCMSFGPLLLGHRDPDVEKSLTEAITKGWSYGACEPYSLELAESIVSKISFIDQVRFVNSGTEAVMTALRLARGATSRSKIIKFNGCYHGHTDSMLIKAGSGLAGTSTASSAGVPNSVACDTLIIELGDTEEVVNCFKDHVDQIAAVIIEPLPANNGLLPQQKEFLQFLRKITQDNNSLLIFDEVISGFRVGLEGMAGLLGISPDIVTYGKIIGGGLPVGAVAGKKEIMEHLAPVGSVYQAGTLSANPLAMAGGLANINKLTDDLYKQIDKNSSEITAVFSEWLKNFNNGQFSHFELISKSSLFWIVPGKNITKVDEIPHELTEKFYPLFEELLSRGIYLSPNAYEVGFVSIAHDENVIKDLKNRLWS